MAPARMPSASGIVVAVLLVGALALGTVLRLKDPLSGPLAAEDPYTHVVFTKEALERGWFGDSFYLGTSLYPPGIHAFGGVVAPLSGIHLYDLARFAPVALGVLAILATFALANRLAGPTAGLAAALLTAVMPEHVFRTNLYAPTAFDLALLPAWLLLFVLAVTPRDEEPADLPLDRSPLRAGAAIGSVVLGLSLAVLHPWAVPLLGIPLLAYAALRTFRARGSFRALAPAMSVVAIPTVFALATRWDGSSTGFSDFLAKLGPLAVLGQIQLAPPLLFVVLLLLVGALALGAAAVASWAGRANAVLPRGVRLSIALAVAGAVLFGAVALSRSLPVNVEYFSQLQPATVLLALAGIVVALARPTRLGDLALCISLFLLPLTAIDVFESEFWPQRTVAYLAIGAALLAATTVAWLARVSLAPIRNPRALRVAAPVVVALSIVLVAGAVAAKPMPVYPWYRLYSNEHLDGFERAADALALDPDARAIVYAWQPALMVKTLASPAQARYSEEFFKSGSARGEVLAEEPGHAKYVVIDKITQRAAKEGKISLSFLEDGRYELVYRSPDGGFRLYEVRG